MILIFRRKLPQFNSIEEIFSNLFWEFSKNVPIEKVEVPNERVDAKSAFSNLKFIRQRRKEVNHITGHVNYIALATGKNTILTVHDIGSSFYGNALHRLLIKTFWYWLPALIVKEITVISESSKKELVKLIPFAKGKITVIHNPVSDKLLYSPKIFNKNNPLILHIGTKSNKNLERTIAALKGIRCRLHVIGDLSQEQMELLVLCSIDYKNKKNVAFSEIKAAYEECDLLSFASLYEGFGMPVIEAQAVGRPVLSSNISSIPEVAGDAACLVNPKDTEEIRNGILKIIEDDDYRNELIKKGLENVKRFQIKKIAAQYLNLYKEVANA